ncbi:MAG: hypothetical protein QOC95_2134 [Thermoleophilaceae bacterium]|nr:hypothetical protein [Thermoleophilaceae bacterium]
MKKTGLICLTGFTALAVAGCGGGSSNKALSYSDFGKQASAICKVENPKVKAASAGLTGQAKTDAPVYDKLIPALQSATGKLEALKPPSKLQSTFDQIKSLDAQQIAAAKKAQSQAKAGDQAGYVATVKSLQPLSKQSDALASKLGAAGCIGS